MVNWYNALVFSFTSDSFEDSSHLKSTGTCISFFHLTKVVLGSNPSKFILYNCGAITIHSTLGSPLCGFDVELEVCLHF